jgi:hypothetical protein
MADTIDIMSRQATRCHFIAAILLLVALLAGCGPASIGSHATALKLATYTNTTYGFSIRYPAGWPHETNPPAFMAAHPTADFAVFWMKPAPNGRTVGGLDVGVSYWRDRLTPAQTASTRRLALKTLKQLVGRRLPDSTNLIVERVRTKRVDGELAISMHCVNPATRQSFDQYWIFHAGVLYQVTFSGSTSDFATIYRGLPDTFTLR